MIIDILFQKCQGHHWIRKGPFSLPLDKLIILIAMFIDTLCPMLSLLCCIIVYYIELPIVNDKNSRLSNCWNHDFCCCISQNIFSSHFFKYIFIGKSLFERKASVSRIVPLSHSWGCSCNKYFSYCCSVSNTSNI